MLFDRICAQNDIRHLLTAPYSPTTTGKVERLHKTMRKEFLVDHDRVHATIEEFQTALDTWVSEYNTDRPHQSLGDRPPQERFALGAVPSQATEIEEIDVPEESTAPSRPAGVNRWVDQNGRIGLGKFRYRVGATFAGESVEVVARAGLVEILHSGVLITTHAERRRPETPSQPVRSTRQGRSRPPTSGLSVSRIVGKAGTISFASTDYRVGRSWIGRHVDVAVVAGSVQISEDTKVIRVHAIRHDRLKEHGAYARPKGRPAKAKVA